MGCLKIRSLVILIFLFIFLLNFVFSSSVINLENKEDVFYPPEEALLKQNQTLESYKQSLVDTAPQNRNSSVDNIWAQLHYQEIFTSRFC